MFNPLSAASWCSKSSSVLSLAGYKSGVLQMLLLSTFCCEYMCQGSRLHMRLGSLPLPLQSVIPLPYSVSSRAGLRSQMWRTYPLALSLKRLPLPLPSPSSPFNLLPTHTHTQILGLWVFSVTLCRWTYLKTSPEPQCSVQMYYVGKKKFKVMINILFNKYHS